MRGSQIRNEAALKALLGAEEPPPWPSPGVPEEGKRRRASWREFDHFVGHAVEGEGECVAIDGHRLAGDCIGGMQARGAEMQRLLVQANVNVGGGSLQVAD